MTGSLLRGGIPLAEVILFGGTTEGREISELLKSENIDSLACVATEYGESLCPSEGSFSVKCGRLTADEIAVLIGEHHPKCVIDATHPYAFGVSENISNACSKTGTKYIRVLRETCSNEGCAEFDTLEELILWLKENPGTVFSTLGVKEASLLTSIPDFENRVWLRILPSAEGLSSCLALGFPPKHIICMQGPFSDEMNRAMLSFSNADILITKESGPAGGFPEKLSAAKALGVTVAVIRRKQENGISLGEIKKNIEERKL